VGITWPKCKERERETGEKKSRSEEIKKAYKSDIA
jgi:hypothetical protein